ncbi:S49 family peptidase [Rhodopseudomonas palustris]|uniref:S49 family peptidase n=1 Tax=Rhodopseudomonas palustris TaxID=1076 RepID=A0A418V160_RHOPL|nr:S49 family peptidase [Rhodopseudomonas palustris]RJF69594.1 S49 family peptidase [Rhodopseudomonas palustris]
MTKAPETAADWPAELNEPLFMLDSRVGEIAKLFASRAEALAAAASASPRVAVTRYATAGATAVIPVRGSLVNWGDVDLSRYGATSFGHLAEALHAAASDGAVERIVLQINSPGGVVEGSDTVVDALRAARAAKPLVSHVDGLGASCGYLFAAQAHEIVITALSRLGSIGVYTGHIDYSGMMERLGLKVTHVASGQHKLDGSPYERLPDDVRAAMQDEVDDLRIGLVNDIAAGRGDRLTAAAALATEARMYRGRVNASGRSEAIDAGLADRISSLRDLLASTTRSYSPTKPPKGKSMDTISRADHDAAVAAARSEGASAERSRIAGVMALDEAKGREASALGLALAAGITADTAKSILAGLPKSSAPSLPAGRAQDAPGGLVLVQSASAPGELDQQRQMSEFERGRAIARGLNLGAKS